MPYGTRRLSQSSTPGPETPKASRPTGLAGLFAPTGRLARHARRPQWSSTEDLPAKLAPPQRTASRPRPRKRSRTRPRSRRRPLRGVAGRRLAACPGPGTCRLPPRIAKCGPRAVIQPSNADSKRQRHGKTLLRSMHLGSANIQVGLRGLRPQPRVPTQLDCCALPPRRVACRPRRRCALRLGRSFCNLQFGQCLGSPTE